MAIQGRIRGLISPEVRGRSAITVQAARLAVPAELPVTEQGQPAWLPPAAGVVAAVLPVSVEVEGAAAVSAAVEAVAEVVVSAGGEAGVVAAVLRQVGADETTRTLG